MASTRVLVASLLLATLFVSCSAVPPFKSIGNNRKVFNVSTETDLIELAALTFPDVSRNTGNPDIAVFLNDLTITQTIVFNAPLQFSGLAVAAVRLTFDPTLEGTGLIFDFTYSFVRFVGVTFDGLKAPRSGPLVQANRGNFEFRDCIFLNGRSSAPGAALVVANTGGLAAVSVTGSSYARDNRALFGGAFAVNGLNSRLFLCHTRTRDNSASDPDNQDSGDGVVYNGGAAALCYGGAAVPTAPQFNTNGTLGRGADGVVYRKATVDPKKCTFGACSFYARIVNPGFQAFVNDPDNFLG